MHGYGIYTWADGSIYEGEFLEGKPRGMGKVTEYKNGRTHEGVFENVDMILNATHGPDSYVLSKGVEEARAYL